MDKYNKSEENMELEADSGQPCQDSNPSQTDKKKRKLDLISSASYDRESKRNKSEAQSGQAEQHSQLPPSGEQIDAFPTQEEQSSGPNNNLIEQVTVQQLVEECEPLPISEPPDLSRISPVHLEFTGPLEMLADATAKIENQHITLRELCAQWGIKPMVQGIPMELLHVPFVSYREDMPAIDIATKLIRMVARKVENYTPFKIIDEGIFEEIRALIRTAVGEQADDSRANLLTKLRKLLPETLSLVGHWSDKARLLITASEQDFTAQLYANLFEPFFNGLDHSACTDMPLPPPFTSLRRLPNMRAFIKKLGVEFIYFIHEDSPHKGSDKYHKDLHKLVQLMRCALQLQLLHIHPSAERREIYCFGMLTSGYCLKLFQMRVRIFSVEDYTTPIYELWVEPELDLKNYDKQSLEKLMTWLAAIRYYDHCLRNSLDIWQSSVQPKKDKTNDDDQGPHGLEPNNNDSNNTNSQLELNQYSSPHKLSARNSGANTEAVDKETLDAIVNHVKKKEFYLFKESEKDNKQVVLVCTTVKSVRLFVVKVYGANNGNEVNVLKFLGQHPNICQLLGLAKLDSEVLTVQPLYENSDNWYNSYMQRDQFPLVLLQLAKGLAYMHEHSVIHSDIKPYNFMVDSDCNTRIIDFDFSVRVGIDDVGKLGFTRGYSAPEWYKQYKNIAGELLTTKVDIWSLAITISEHDGVSFGEVVDPLERRKKVLQKLNNTESLMWPVRSLIERMLSVHQNERPTASEVFDELVKVYGDRGITRNEVQAEQAVGLKAIDYTTNSPRKVETEKIPQKYEDENWIESVKSKVTMNHKARGALVDITNVVK